MRPDASPEMQWSGARCPLPLMRSTRQSRSAATCGPVATVPSNSAHSNTPRVTKNKSQRIERSARTSHVPLISVDEETAGPVPSLAVKDVVAAIVRGAQEWSENQDAQMRWEENLEQVKPKSKSYKLSAVDQAAAYQKHTTATRWRWWQAMFLTSCALTLATRDSGRAKALSSPVKKSTALRYRRLARLLVQVMNYISDRTPGVAFNIIPALSGKTIDTRLS